MDEEERQYYERNTKILRKLRVANAATIIKRQRAKSKPQVLVLSPLQRQQETERAMERIREYREKYGSPVVQIKVRSLRSNSRRGIGLN
jgi:hypothetical protein